MTNGFVTIISTLEDLVQFLEKIIPKQSEEAEDADMKFQAEMLLSDPRRELLIPTQEEWLGFNLLERDGEIRRRKGTPK